DAPCAVAHVAGGGGRCVTEILRLVCAVDELVPEQRPPPPAPVGIEQVHQPGAGEHPEKEQPRIPTLHGNSSRPHRCPPDAACDSGGDPACPDHARSSSSRTSSSDVWSNCSYQIPTAWK